MSQICIRIEPLKKSRHINQRWEHNNNIKDEKGNKIDPDWVGGWLAKSPKDDYGRAVARSLNKMRKEGVMEYSRANPGTEIKAVEMIITGSPEWFRDQSKLPKGWRDLDEKSKAEMWKRHPADPQKVEQFKQKSLEMLRDKLAPEALANLTLHNHETTPHLHAILLPIPHPEPNRKLRMSYEKLFGMAKGKKAKNGYEEWQDIAGDYFGGMGLERGKRGSLDTHQRPAQWKAQQAEITASSTAEEQKMRDYIRKRDLVKQWGGKAEGLFKSEDENKKIKEANRLISKGYTAEKYEGLIIGLTRRIATQAKSSEIEARNLTRQVQEMKAEKAVKSKVANWAITATKCNPAQAKKVIDQIRLIAEPPTPAPKQPTTAPERPTALPFGDLPNKPAPKAQIKPIEALSQAKPTPTTISPQQASGDDGELYKRWEDMSEAERAQYLRNKDQSRARAPRPR